MTSLDPLAAAEQSHYIKVSFDVNTLMIQGKEIRGMLEGKSIPDIPIPQLIELSAQGHFPFEKLMKFYSLDQINQAAQDSEKRIERS
jgi:aryl-alcohol dehydrogenase